MADRPPKIELIPKPAGDTASPARAPHRGISPESEAAMRMPSSSMRIDLPSEESSIVPAYAQRRVYAPPKLSHPIPGKVKMVEPASQMVSQWLATVVRALRGMNMYADNNSRRKDFVDQSFSVLEDIFAKAMRIELVIAADHIAYGRDLIHYNPDPFESLPRLLYDGSVRKLTITRGVTALELVRFLGAIATDFSRSENAGDDLVGIFGRLNLPHVRAKGPDAPVDQTPKYVAPPPPVLPPPTPAPPQPRETQPERLGSAFFEAIRDVPEPSIDPEPLTVHAAVQATASEIDPFGEDDEATVLAQPAPQQKQKLSDLASMDDEATLQEGMMAPKIDVSDLLDEATKQEGSKKR